MCRDQAKDKPAGSREKHIGMRDSAATRNQKFDMITLILQYRDSKSAVGSIASALLGESTSNQGA
ncbi:uncharacterized protein CLUP02_13871 [Colletotrichum lupini]|uniref:Uncharacterized protein n=1 Tax=Colletotrichum lupini TaxID=145971 RepID=A0A9Q8T393_9PEZI|nr:uncharacterized protein CLUP02_13871 [Colletotrichum lupini]UQC88348.1 hypothetical protein CLUP02_13871 [Colletotrichum lupini]